jgi:hypothetical protein
MKVILTESQVKKLIEGVSNTLELNEGVSDRYSKEIAVEFYPPRGVLYKGNEINDVDRVFTKISYNIEIEAREWGIKDISLSGIQGENELEVEVDYYIDENNTTQETTTIQLNWDDIKIENNSGEGVVTVGDSLEITLKNDENGNLIVAELLIPIYTL